VNWSVEKIVVCIFKILFVQYHISLVNYYQVTMLHSLMSVFRYFKIDLITCVLYVSCRAGTIRSAADKIRIWYRPCRYDTYLIRYTCTWLKVSKSIILDFNNKVNVLGWSVHWIKQILVLKQNDHLCRVYHSYIHKVYI